MTIGKAEWAPPTTGGKAIASRQAMPTLPAAVLGKSGICNLTQYRQRYAGRMSFALPALTVQVSNHEVFRLDKAHEPNEACFVMVLQMPGNPDLWPTTWNFGAANLEIG